MLLDDVLPYSAMAEVWNHLHVLREQFLEQLGRLLSAASEAVDAAMDAFASGAELPLGLRQGPPLLTDADPRHGFRDGEATLARMFTEPWRMLNAASTLGGVIKGRLEDFEVQADQLGDEVAVPTEQLQRLGDDREDIHGLLAVATMERLIRRLELLPSRRLAELVRAAVLENVREGRPATGSMQARRRQGVRSAARASVDVTAREEIADRYVGQLMDRLAEH